MLMRRPAVFLPLFLIVFAVPAEALTRISPTAVLAGGPAFTLRGFADDEAFDSDESTLTWRRADQGPRRSDLAPARSARESFGRKCRPS